MLPFEEVMLPFEAWKFPNLARMCGMQNYIAKRRKEIKAMQWFQSMGEIKDIVFKDIVFKASDQYYVVTIHGQRTYIVDGDFIVQEPDGVHYYPVKPGIFTDTYEGKP